MKKLTNPFKLSLTLALLLAASWSYANNGGDVDKHKSYTKSYPVSATDRVSINNKFGEVKIVIGNSSEVKVEVSITAHSASDEKAQSILDGITIEDGKDKDGVWFKTHIANVNVNTNDNRNGNKDGDKDKDKGDKDKDKDKEKNKEGKGDRKAHNSGMEINYTVSMPAQNPLLLHNEFGKATLPDMSGPVDITEKFGELVAGNLSNVKNLIVEFGSANIESIANCKVTVKFSTASIKKMTGAIKGNFEFCGNVKLPLDNGVTDFSLNNSYSTVEVNVSNNFNGDFDIKTSFSEFHNKTELAIKEEKEDSDNHGPHFNKVFTGKTGTGACKVKVKSSFGDIKLI